jgi:lipooligosaccharide transport system permease protein
VSTPTIIRATEVWARTYRRTWRGSAFSTVLTPVLFLAAMGAGLGSLVDEGRGHQALGGLDYLTFLAPGLLAASAMQTGATEAMYPVMARIKWIGSYHAMLATPIGVTELAGGQLLWISARVAITSVVFVAVMAIAGVVESAWVVLAIPAAVLTGMAFAAPIAAYTASVRNEYALSTLLRFGILPSFLLSGTFFPLDQLPTWLQVVAHVLPLWHGVTLCRSLALGTAGVLPSLGHAAYLVLWIAAGTTLAVVRFRRKLVT